MGTTFLLNKKREEKGAGGQTTFNSVQDYGMIQYVQLYEKWILYVKKHHI